MNEHVIVEKVLSPTRVTVVCSTTACVGCKGEMFCTNKGRSFEASKPLFMNLKPGDPVDVHLKTGRTIASSFITLIIPLLFFPVVFFILSKVGASEMVSLFGGLGGSDSAF
jgi:sigma-E factor negative regulatory protein RseC